MIYSTGVCKLFPPPLVRGGVFLVGSEPKYRDIADEEHPYFFSCFTLFHLAQNRQEYSHVLM